MNHHHADWAMQPRGTRLAWTALGLGLMHAAISVYWALGGTWLLDTIGGALEARGRAGDPLLLTVIWGTVGLKLITAIVGLLAVSPEVIGFWRRIVRFIAWSAAAILVAYGGVLTLVGLLVQASVIPIEPDADQAALAWHAYVWDPWFLLWGLALGSALWRSRTRGAGGNTPR